VFERVEKRGLLLLRAIRIEDTGVRITGKRRGAGGHEPRRALANAGSFRFGKRRDGVPEDERLGKRDLERAQAASEAAFAAKDIAGTGVFRRFHPRGVSRSDTGPQSID